MKGKMMLAAVIFLNSSAFAQQDTSSIDEVVVTATRDLVKQSQTGKVVSVIDNQTLERNVGRSLSEILNENSVFFINGANQAAGSNMDYYLRGSATSNTLVLIDGIPVSDVSQINSYFDFNSISPAQVEKIEILRGAQSTLWGSNAVAGVINIITKKERSTGFQSNAFLNYGSYNTLKAGAGVNGSGKNLQYNVQYGLLLSKGFSSAYDSLSTNSFDNDNYRQHNVQAGLGYRFSPALSADLSTRLSVYRAGIDAGAFTDDRDATIKNSGAQHSLAVTFKKEKYKLHFTNTLVDDDRNLSNDSGHVGGFAKWEDARYRGNSFISELYGSFSLAKQLTMVTGLQYQQQQMSQDYKSLSDYGTFEALLGDTAKTNNIAAYSSLQFLGQKGFSAEAGLRVNHHSIYGSNTTFSVNPFYAINANVRLFVNISSAFKVPSLYQLYSEYGNKLLQPETSYNYEAGVQAFLREQQGHIRITFFRRDIQDVIAFVTDPNTWLSKYENRDEQQDFGLELENTISLGKKGEITTSATYVDGEGRTGELKYDNFHRRPKFSFKTTAALSLAKNWELTPSFRYIGQRPKGEYDAGPSTMPDYFMVNLFTAYQLHTSFKIFAELNNLTNQSYVDVPGYSVRKRNFNVGIRWSK